jgi:DDE superfamily endonuclease
MAVMHRLGSVGAVDQGPIAEAADRLRSFRDELYRCWGRRAGELFELTDALLCAEGPVSSLVRLCLAPEHRRGHGALYDALNCGWVDAQRRARRHARRRAVSQNSPSTGP